MKSLLPKTWHFYIYIFSLVLLVIGMPVSKFLMSLSQIILAANWILEGDLKNKFTSFFKNKPALVVSSVLLMHYIGLLYTSDFGYAFKDIRIKWPILILPLILATSAPLSKKVFEAILKFFVAGVIVGTIISTLIYFGIIHRQVVDIRNISIFISHIRFALLICVAFFVCFYLLRFEAKTILKALWLAIVLWLVCFLVLFESMTGLSILVICSLILGIGIIFKASGKRSKYIAAASILLLFGFVTMYLTNVIRQTNVKTDVIDPGKLVYETAHGGSFHTILEDSDTENGHYVWMEFCPEELEATWNKRSSIRYDQKDLKGNEVRFTLMRFLASKGLRKDQDAVNSLSEEEIKAIERGVTNVNYQNVSSIEGRIHEILWEIDLYKKTGDPNGHSLTQRYVYWKAALGIISQHPLIGVGTGDVQRAFDEEYDRTNSPLRKEWRVHSHNQYLTIAVAFGIIGLCWFLFSLIYPMLKLKMHMDFLYVSFFIIALISFLTEDTLETQAGVTFFIFFNSFYLFVKSRISEATV